MIRREDSLEYHGGARPGKIEVNATKPCLTPREIRLAYLPGATFPAWEIAADPAAAFRYTARGNLVGVITNGTAVPGLGDVGPLAAKPMQEGIAVLFKRLADIDVFDLELDTTGSRALHRDGAAARADLRRNQPEGPPRPRGARHLRPARGGDADPGVPREPLQHGGGGGRRPDQRARPRRQAHRGGPGRHLRRGHGGHRLRAPAARRWACRPRTCSSTTSAGSSTRTGTTSHDYQRAFARADPARRLERRAARAPTSSWGRRSAASSPAT